MTPTPQQALHALQLRDIKRRIDAGEYAGCVYEPALLSRLSDAELEAFAKPIAAEAFEAFRSTSALARYLKGNPQ